MLYGRSGIGKTAVAWEMAHAIQAGEPLWGMPTVQTNVLFIELDTPFELVQNRWITAEPPYDPNFSIVFHDQSMDYKQLLLPMPDEDHAKFAKILTGLHKEQQYGVVFVDALREVVHGDLSSSGIAKRVYDAFHLLFPGATVVFIHHERKSSNNPQFGSSDPIFSASGSMEFINTAQVGIQFHKKGRETFLAHNKTQASAEMEPLPISLRPDGVHVYHRDEENEAIAAKIMSEHEGTDIAQRDLDKLIGEAVGKQEKTGRNLKLAVRQRAAMAAAKQVEAVIQEVAIEDLLSNERLTDAVPRQTGSEADTEVCKVA